MANQEHLDQLEEGIDAWNTWRQKFPDIQPDLNKADLSGADLRDADLYEADLRDADLYEADFSRADLRGADLYGANLHRADLRRADLRGTDLYKADLRGANLLEADLSGANLREADLTGDYDLIAANLSRAHLNDANLGGAILNGANLSSAWLYHAVLSGVNLIDADLSGAVLSEANLSEAFLYGANLRRASLERSELSSAFLCGADLYEANLTEANLSGANLSGAILVETDFTNATLSNCRVYGTGVWNTKLQRAKQENLIITPSDEATITVDTLEVAQFVYLLLNNPKIRDILDTIARKAVLILGRFTPQQKALLYVLKEALRAYGYVPILFDFEKPKSRNLTETVRTLAHLAHFIIADLTESSSIPQELQAIVPLLAVPVQPILLEKKNEYSMFWDFQRYHWVLPVHYYKDQASLETSIQKNIIEPAEQKARELEQKPLSK